jgi:hypothetical protein
MRISAPGFLHQKPFRVGDLQSEEKMSLTLALNVFSREKKLPTLTRKNAAMEMTRTAATVATTITGIS